MHRAWPGRPPGATRRRESRIPSTRRKRTLHPYATSLAQFRVDLHDTGIRPTHSTLRSSSRSALPLAAGARAAVERNVEAPFGSSRAQETRPRCCILRRWPRERHHAAVEPLRRRLRVSVRRRLDGSAAMQAPESSMSGVYGRHRFMAEIGRRTRAALVDRCRWMSAEWPCRNFRIRVMVAGCTPSVCSLHVCVGVEEQKCSTARQRARAALWRVATGRVCSH